MIKTGQPIVLRTDTFFYNISDIELKKYKRVKVFLQDPKTTLYMT
jgi:hypothetical protein